MPHTLHFLVLALAGWVNRHQEDLIDYLREENRVLVEAIAKGDDRILLVVDPKTFGFRRNEDNSLKCAPSIRCSPTSIS